MSGNCRYHVIASSLLWSQTQTLLHRGKGVTPFLWRRVWVKTKSKRVVHSEYSKPWVDLSGLDEETRHLPMKIPGISVEYLRLWFYTILNGYFVYLSCSLICDKHPTGTLHSFPVVVYTFIPAPTPTPVAFPLVWRTKRVNLVHFIMR